MRCRRIDGDGFTSAFRYLLIVMGKKKRQNFTLSLKPVMGCASGLEAAHTIDLVRARANHFLYISIAQHSLAKFFKTFRCH